VEKMSDIDETKQELAADGKDSGVEEENHEPYPFDAEKISISNKKISLSNVVSRWNRNLIHAAELQRREDLWDDGKKSRLIESLMLKIPLPLFYASGSRDDELFVVDGLQRLSAIKGYISEEKYKLEALEFLKELEGKKFSELPERMQIRINETELDFAIISPDSPPEVQRNIFKRLNTGGLPLTEQEIRHALYFGPVTALLTDIVDSKQFQIAVDYRVKDSRMAAQELVLRYFSFAVMNIKEYKKDDEMDSFLSDAMQIINQAMEPEKYMKKNSQLLIARNIENKDIEKIKARFFIAMERASELFENCAFRITTPAKYSREKYRTPINKSLFEAWSIVLSNMKESDFEKLKRNKESLYEMIDKEFDNKESSLRNYISKGSLKVSGVKGRYEVLKKIILDVLKDGK
jgi:hypothetical protein